MSNEAVPLNHYTQGDPDAPAVVLGASLGTTLAMWDGLAATLSRRFHVIRFDTRGHGSSPVPPGPYAMEDLAADVVGLADELELARFGFVGLSLGGATGLTLAIDHADRLSSLVLCCTAPRFGDPANWQERARRVRDEGMAWLVDATRERWFTPQLLEESPELAEPVLAMLGDTDPNGYAACCDAMAAYDVTTRLATITTPTLVVGADRDPVAPLEVTDALAKAIPGADRVVIADAAHIANVAQPDAFDSAVLAHLERTLLG